MNFFIRVCKSGRQTVALQPAINQGNSLIHQIGLPAFLCGDGSHQVIRPLNFRGASLQSATQEQTASSLRDRRCTRHKPQPPSPKPHVEHHAPAGRSTGAVRPIPAFSVRLRLHRKATRACPVPQVASRAKLKKALRQKTEKGSQPHRFKDSKRDKVPKGR